VGLIKPEAMSFARFSTDDTSGKMRGYVGEGRFRDDPLSTSGGAGVVEIPKLQKLLHFICERGFEHNVAANLSTSLPPYTKPALDIWDRTCTGMIMKVEPANGHRGGSRFRYAERSGFSGR
jgi:hypothetical protein